MNKLLDKAMIYTAYLYVIVPFLLFTIGWLRWYYALPICVVTIVSMILALRRYEFREIDLAKHRKKIIIALVSIFIIVFFSGIGSYSYQNEDQDVRNGIFSDLVTHSWPYMLNAHNNVPELQRPVLFVYYIEYWLPAALTGKLFGMAAARFFFYLWTVLGITLIYYFLCRMFNRFSLRLLFIFLFFDGLYFYGGFLAAPIKTVLVNDYTLWLGNMLLAGSNLGGMFWTFNQTIVPWLIAILILNNIPKQNMMFLYALCYAHGPFFFIGFFPFLLIVVIRDMVKSKEPFTRAIVPYFSFQSVVGGLTTLLTGYFFLACSTAVEALFIQHTSIGHYLLLVFLCFGAISTLIFSKYKRDPTFYTVVIMLLILPLLGLGTIQPLTFCARVSLAPMFMLMLLAAKYYFEEGSTLTKKLVVIYFIVGALDPALQLGRSIVFTTGFYLNREKMNKYLYNRSGGSAASPGPVDFKNDNLLIQNNLRSLDNPRNPHLNYSKLQKDSTFFLKYLLKDK